MAIAVFAAMFSVACVPAGVGAVIGFVVARRRARAGLASPSLPMLTLGGFAAGLVAGLVALVLTFSKAEAPQPQIAFDAPGEFEHDEVFVIEDPTVSLRLQWDESHLRATVPVSANGVVRVNSLEEFLGGPLNASLHGASNIGGSSRPPPSGIPGRALLCLQFVATSEATAGGCGVVRSAEWIRGRELAR